MAQYRAGSQKIKTGMKKAKENWIGEQCQNIDCLKKNNSKKAYKLVQDLTGTKLERTTTIQDRGGTCLTENEDILKRWTEFCSELYNYRATGDPEVLNATPSPQQPITRSREDHCWGTSRLPPRTQHYRADLQLQDTLWEVPPTPTGPLSCLHWLQKVIRQGVARSTLGNYEVVQYQYKPYQCNSESLRQGHQCSLLQRQHRRLLQNYSQSKTGLPALTHPLQHIPGENHGWCTWRSQIDSQHWRQDNLKLTFCWWHRRPGRLRIS